MQLVPDSGASSMNTLPQGKPPHPTSSSALYRAHPAKHSQGLRSRRRALQPAQLRSSRPCRCQSLPEGSGRPLANLRAWGAGLFNSLRTGWADQPEQQQGPQQGAPKQQPQQQGSEGAREADALLVDPAATAGQPRAYDNEHNKAVLYESEAPAIGQPKNYVDEHAELVLYESDEEEAAEPPEEGTWEHWEEHFGEMDRLYEAACEVEGAIEESVAAEQYAEAARLRGVHADIQERDNVNTVLKELQQALEQEDYARAAQLRDSGCAGLVGWWHSRAEDDPVGHILRIAPDFGRYTAVKYSAQDLAELKGWNSELNMMAGYGAGVSYGPVAMSARPQQQERSSADELIAELMQQAGQGEQGSLGVAVMEVFVRRDSQGNWQRQACVASPSEDAQEAGQGMAFAAGLPPTLDIHVDHGNPGEDVIAMRISLSPNGQPTITDANASSIEDIVRNMMARDEGPTDEQNMLPAETMEQSQGMEGGALMVVEEESSSSDEQGYQQSFKRSPANLVRMDNNNFVLTVPAPKAEELSQEQLEVLESDPHADHQAQFDGLRQALNMSDPTDTGLTSLILPPPVRPPQAEERKDKSSAGGKDEGAAIDPWMKAAKEVKRLHKLNNPNTPLPISGDDLADAIKSAASGALDVLQQSYSVPNFCLEGSRVYSRINQDAMPMTDPFSGLYLGSFGPHGPEILQLKRSITESGEECVLGVKVTGDTNVPAGNISFRALIRRKHRATGYDVMYPPELDVQARYPGEGRVAQQGFKDAWWVEGELLHFGSNNSMIHGAELGFVWCVPNERRYLILLSRINLDDPRLNT